MKWSRSEKEVTMFVQRILQKRKAMRSLLQTGVDAVVHDMTEEDILGEIEPDTTSTLSREEMNEMNKLIK